MKKILLRLVPVLSALALAGAVSSGGALAQDPPPKATPVEPRAYRLLTDALTFLQQAPRFTFRAEATYDLNQEGGASVEFGSSTRVAVSRPRGLWMDAHTDSGKKTAWFDGTRFTLFDENRCCYFSTALPGTNDEALERMARDYQVRFPLDALLRSDAAARMQKMVLGGYYAGVHAVDGIECHHLVLVGDKADAQVWIDTGPTPVLRKLVLRQKDAPGWPRHTLRLADWDFSPALPETAFGPVMPRGAILSPIEALKPKASTGTR